MVKILFVRYAMKSSLMKYMYDMESLRGQYMALYISYYVNDLFKNMASADDIEFNH